VGRLKVIFVLATVIVGFGIGLQDLVSTLYSHQNAIGP